MSSIISNINGSVNQVPETMEDGMSDQLHQGKCSQVIWHLNWPGKERMREGMG